MFLRNKILGVTDCQDDLENGNNILIVSYLYNLATPMSFID